MSGERLDVNNGEGLISPFFCYDWILKFNCSALSEGTAKSHIYQARIGYAPTLPNPCDELWDLSPILLRCWRQSVRRAIECQARIPGAAEADVMSSLIAHFGNPLVDCP
ncbi:uncharacterized protein BDCG_16294 [Blastomyces dermatitidis ER-3]|uniref:Uncharacterized protein n=1 Tax=Ajellomyces dermatitidis (strain ER-3 / ATCC MYA-2586) TaxID=559297 RepID=A0ABP2EM11_AJEDR|nr:uncharacterized protein BDCG_16294 [Blastomyces dermatitidis ER-3]EEQ84358.2 hypothetical protein BDCG_16294 [Blastomyces dermatitidis ER-3]